MISTTSAALSAPFVAPVNHPGVGFPDAVGPILGTATLIIQDHADSLNPPPERRLEVQVTRVLPNPDGTYTLPDGNVISLPPES